LIVRNYEEFLSSLSQAAVIQDEQVYLAEIQKISNKFYTLGDHMDAAVKNQLIVMEKYGVNKAFLQKCIQQANRIVRQAIEVAKDLTEKNMNEVQQKAARIIPDISLLNVNPEIVSNNSTSF
jgi:hypothetical protein